MSRRWTTIVVVAVVGMFAFASMQGSAYGVDKVLKVTKFAPQKADAGSVVTIKGRNFLGVTAVKFNGVPAVFTIDSSRRIHATVPVGATTGQIAVTTNAQTTAESKQTFTMLFDVVEASFMNCLASGNANVPAGTEPYIGVSKSLANESYVKAFRKSTVTTLSVNGGETRIKSLLWDKKGEADGLKWETYWGYDTKTVLAKGDTITLGFHVTATKEFSDGFQTFKPGQELFVGSTCALHGV